MAGLTWWQRAVFYQIYPRSFADGNGDGLGDFAGMTARLDYLRALGIDAIWLSPHYPSPYVDCGYDISDYSAVAPEYGTLDDFKRFLDEAHARNIRVITDLVLNHSSDQHPWFLDSRASRDNPKRDWFVWDDGRDGGPPNNWCSIFGGSAWEWDEGTGQYYYHAFLKEQPDLNWRNPEVKAAMWAMMRFWLELGVDGFRLDAISTIFEHPALPNHEAHLSPTELLREGLRATSDEERRRLHDESQRLFRYQFHQPGLHELMQELRALVDEFPGDRLLVGEDEDVAFHGSGDDELQLLFNFPLMRVRRLTPTHIRANQALRLAALPIGAWPCNTLGNHDSNRLWSRYGDGQHDAALARLHLALMLTLKGTPFLYNGEEIGMADLELSRLAELRDSAATNQYALLVGELGYTPQDALQAVLATTRDRCRSPLQWSDGPNAGFCPAEVEPWLPVHPNHAAGVNVAAQQEDPDSLLTFYQTMLRLRRATPALVSGDYHALHATSASCLAFQRHDAASGQRVLVVLNFDAEAQTLAFDGGGADARLLYRGASASGSLTLDRLALAPFEIVIVEVAEAQQPAASSA